MRQAFNILTSSKFVDALDVTKEDPKVRERYGKGQDNPAGGFRGPRVVQGKKGGMAATRFPSIISCK